VGRTWAVQCWRSLSLFSLSHTLGYLSFLGACGIFGLLEKEGKGKAGKHRKESRSTSTSVLLADTELHECFLH